MNCMSYRSGKEAKFRSKVKCIEHGEKPTNISHQILSKVLARRMEKILPKLVHSDQTGFVNGRYIEQNVRLLNDVMEYTDIKKLPGSFLFADFEKAIDIIEWNFISNTLEGFKFGCNFQKWLWNFNVQSAVLNGGHMTD